MQSESALRGRKINNFVELWCLVASGGYKFWVSWISFQKSNIGCPQQPLTEKVLKSVNILMFWNKIYFGRIMKYQVEFQCLNSLRLLRPADVTFLKTDSWNSKFITSWSHYLGTIIQQNYWSFYPSELIYLIFFTMRHPVIYKILFRINIPP